MIINVYTIAILWLHLLALYIGTFYIENIYFYILSLSSEKPSLENSIKLIIIVYLWISCPQENSTSLSYVDTSKWCVIPFSFIECKVYKTLNEKDRSQSYLYKSDQGARPTCDRWLTRDWYRFTGLAGNRMPDKCVPVQRCGTLAPGWLQGGHPSVHAGVVTRMVCFSWGRDCCTWRSRILVRNCGDFYVYKLQNAPVCKLRYCGVGNSEGKIWSWTPSGEARVKRGDSHNVMWHDLINRKLMQNIFNQRFVQKSWNSLYH